MDWSGQKALFPIFNRRRDSQALPMSDCLSENMIEDLVFKDENGNVSITDVQYLALENGIAHGNSNLIVSPTSTGKTQIAIWTIAKI